jgi:hypothetical protein
LTWQAADRPPSKETALSDAPESLAGERLLRTIDAIDEDVALIELWACALSSFAQPAPDYGLRDKYRDDDARNEASAAA